MKDPMRLAMHELTPEQDQAVTSMKIRGNELWDFIDKQNPHGREYALAKTHLETAIMWAVKGITMLAEASPVVVTPGLGCLYCARQAVDGMATCADLECVEKWGSRDERDRNSACVDCGAIGGGHFKTCASLPAARS